VEPVIRNFRNIYTPEGPGARLISLDDGPPTCTMSYSEIYPGKTSTHHIHPWEHEVYIIKGVGTLVCDGKEYPVKEGDAMFIPGNVDHYTLNNGGQGVIRRIEVNPLSAAQSGSTRNQGGRGTGKPPVIRNYRDLSAETGSRILSTKDGVPNYVMLYNGEMTPGTVSHPESGGHAHPWEHIVYILEGYGTLFCDGKEYTVAEGDGVLVPPNSFHQWRNTSALPMKRVTFNPIAAEGQGG
jgi:quercetin dioxygenase-like cupin family protein